MSLETTLNALAVAIYATFSESAKEQSITEEDEKM